MLSILSSESRWLLFLLLKMLVACLPYMYWTVIESNIGYTNGCINCNELVLTLQFILSKRNIASYQKLYQIKLKFIEGANFIDSLPVYLRWWLPSLVGIENIGQEIVFTMSTWLPQNGEKCHKWLQQGKVGIHWWNKSKVAYSLSFYGISRQFGLFIYFNSSWFESATIQLLFPIDPFWRSKSDISLANIFW